MPLVSVKQARFIRHTVMAPEACSPNSFRTIPLPRPKPGTPEREVHKLIRKARKLAVICCPLTKAGKSQFNGHCRVGMKVQSILERRK